MNAPSSIVRAQVDRLLQVVQAYQQQQCDKILTQAKQEAQQIIDRTYRDARLHLHQDIQESRDRMHRRIAAAQAKSHTLRKKHQHAAERRFLDWVWDLLKTQLRTRWQNREQRQQWIQKNLLEALSLLTSPQWLVEHPTSLAVDELQQLINQVSQNSEIVVEFSVSPDIEVGIRISASGATIDGTLQGLLADRSRIESELLAQYHQYLVRCDA